MIKTSYDRAMKLTSNILDFPWANLNYYAAWLAQSYFYTSHTTRILFLAGAYCKITEDKMHARFAEHAREERHHELLALKDVKDLGHDIHTIKEFPITQAFYRSQYFIIQHEGVESLFGWILFLEGIAIHYGKKIREKVKSSHDKIVTRFLDVHVNDDPEHVAKALEIAKSFSIDAQKKLIAHLYSSLDIYFHILMDCEQWAETTDKKQVPMSTT